MPQPKPYYACDELNEEDEYGYTWSTAIQHYALAEREEFRRPSTFARLYDSDDESPFLAPELAGPYINMGPTRKEKARALVGYTDDTEDDAQLAAASMATTREHDGVVPSLESLCLATLARGRVSAAKERDFLWSRLIQRHRIDSTRAIDAIYAAGRRRLRTSNEAASVQKLRKGVKLDHAAPRLSV